MASTSSPCRVLTRKLSTSELLPSRSPPSAGLRGDLEALRLLTDHQGRKVPTVGGMMLFGKDRQRHLPDAWIQAGRFEGTDKSRIVDRAEICALPVRAIEEAIAFVQQARPPCTAPKSVPCAARSAGGCRPRRCARRSSMRWPMPTTRSAAPRCASRSSTTASRLRTRAFCPSASRSRTCRAASRSCATG